MPKPPRKLKDIHFARLNLCSPRNRGSVGDGAKKTPVSCKCRELGLRVTVSMCTAVIRRYRIRSKMGQFAFAP